MIEDQVLAYFELSNDTLYRKIPKDRIGYYIQSSLKAGKSIAQDYRHQDMKELYQKHHIKVECQKHSPSQFGILFRGMSIFGKDELKVVLYQDSLEELAQHSGIESVNPLSYEEALQLHLAHEFFHYLEYRRKQSVSEQLERVTVQKLFGFNRRCYISRCSEIAAHAFAKEMIHTVNFPNIYDFTYLIRIGKLKEEDFKHRIEEVRDELGLR